MEWIFNIESAAEAMGGVIENCSGDTIISNVSTDTRTIAEGDLFFALQGEKFDAHQFVNGAVEQGAVCCVVKKGEPVPNGLPYIVVDDTQAALRDFAKAYRERFRIPVVGITGSVGKTSTKEMIASVLAQSFRTHTTKGNFNNEIGLPLTVFKLMREDEMMVLEMGMSAFGEISRLTQIAKPDTAVITNIGVSHIEHLGSREGIKQAKFEILEGLSMDGAVILNADDDLLWEAGGEIDFETLYYGIENDNADLLAYNIRTYSDSSTFSCKIDGEEFNFVVEVPGIHHIYNALAAILVGLRYNVAIEDIQKGVRSFAPSGLRQTVIELPDYKIIRDCYNASPASMKSGLSVLALMPTQGRRVACLADMLELGEISKTAHEQVGEFVVENGVDCLIAVGKEAKYIAMGAQKAGMNEDNIYVFEDKTALLGQLGRILKKNDVILVKGSRGMKMEQVADAIAEL
ncbi:MAG: UDP-N-acetylmuramoyl-tripeptide--D-alanyl-D-alanine ligase [Clostridia bacterium]|nr:UDP-N-acetylmuramoyl-tripeptide--D-alanyl-D-alanine ligase [Clostridia bacterium]